MAKIKKTGRHTSGIKAHRQSLKHRANNFKMRGAIKDLRKSLMEAIAGKDKIKAQTLLVESYSKLDKAAKTGIFHWRNAARKKAFLARAVNHLAVAATASP